MNEEFRNDGMNQQSDAEEAEKVKNADAEAEAVADDTAENAETSDKSESAETETNEEDEALNAKYLRLMADFQNYKRRVEKEKSDIYAYANEKIVSELLNVIDNFERALQHECADERYVEGMQMIFKQFAGVLEKAGLEEITAEGEDFDPNFHNAVMTEDNPEFGSGKVTEVLQKGYLLNKKVIRPSMVKVNN